MYKSKSFEVAKATHSRAKAFDRRTPEKAAIDCPICHRKVAKNLWKIHQQSHFNATISRLFRCVICENRFDNAFFLRQHMQTAHPWEGKKPKPCDQCGRYFINESDLALHKSVVNCSIKFECKKCKEGFLTYAQLRAHIMRNTCVASLPNRQSGKPSQAQNDVKSSEQGVRKPSILSRANPAVPANHSVPANHAVPANPVVPANPALSSITPSRKTQLKTPVQKRPNSIPNGGFFESEDCDFSSFQVVNMDSVTSPEAPGNKDHDLLSVRDVTPKLESTSTDSSGSKPSGPRTKTFILEPVYQSQLARDPKLKTKGPRQSDVGSCNMLPRKELTIKVAPDLTIKVLKPVINRPRNGTTPAESLKPAVKRPTFTRSIGILGKKARKEPVVEKRRPVTIAKDKFAKSVLPTEMRFVAQKVSTKLTGVTSTPPSTEPTTMPKSRSDLARVSRARAQADKQFLTHATAVAKDVLSVESKRQRDESEKRLLGRSRSSSSRPSGRTILESSSFQYDPASRTYTFNRRQAEKVEALAYRGEMESSSLTDVSDIESETDDVDIESESSPAFDREEMIDRMDLGEYVDTVMAK